MGGVEKNIDYITSQLTHAYKTIAYCFNILDVIFAYADHAVCASITALIIMWRYMISKIINVYKHAYSTPLTNTPTNHGNGW